MFGDEQANTLNSISLEYLLFVPFILFMIILFFTLKRLQENDRPYAPSTPIFVFFLPFIGQVFFIWIVPSVGSSLTKGLSKLGVKNGLPKVISLVFSLVAALCLLTLALIALSSRIDHSLYDFFERNLDAFYLGIKIAISVASLVTLYAFETTSRLYARKWAEVKETRRKLAIENKNRRLEELSQQKIDNNES